MSWRWDQGRRRLVPITPPFSPNEPLPEKCTSCKKRSTDVQGVWKLVRIGDEWFHVCPECLSKR